MQVKLHLVAMPWSTPCAPSPQLAALQSYIDSVLKERVKTTTYSAFVDILLQAHGEGYINYHDKHSDYGDYLYFLICLRRFLRRNKRVAPVSVTNLVSSLSKSVDVAAPIIRHTIDLLEKKTCNYIEESFVQNLERPMLNIIGFTLSFAQLYPSIYFARYLKEKHPKYRYLFLFGGETVGIPKVATVLRKFEISGIGVVGEGEKKLEQIVRHCLAAPVTSTDALLTEITSSVPGSYDIQAGSVNLFDFGPGMLESQIDRMEELPAPVFDEYFASVKRSLPRRRAWSKFYTEIDLVVEGSRGCSFGRCDFCDVNRSWQGYRTATPEWVAERVLMLVTKYRCPRVWFMDCSCDAWAGKYAKILIDRGVRLLGLMELRAHHPQSFWTQLSLAGVNQVQVGIEAVAPRLLKAMNKGTTVRQNLCVQKWLKEIGIESCSNIITHHPKSTVEDIKVTKRILSQIVHLDRLGISPCALLMGSPIAQGLSLKQQKHLTERQDVSWPKRMDSFLVSNSEFELPKHLRNERVMREWDIFVEWEKDWFGRHHKSAMLTQTRCGSNELMVTDARFKNKEEHFLDGPRAIVYDRCHQGMALAQLKATTGLADYTIRGELNWLLDSKLMLEVEGWFLSLAVRPRDELVRTYIDTSGLERQGDHTLYRIPD